MKNRDYKTFAAGCYYHIYNRGVGKQDIFLTDEDYKVFLSRVKENLLPDQINKQTHPGSWQYARKRLPAGAFSLICHCLMPNHFHFLIKQNGDLSVSKLVSKICTSYSMYFNKKYERVGCLFQDQFKAIAVDNDSYLLWLSAYIHQNPTVAGLAKTPENYQWSSYPDYVGLRKGVICQKDFVLGQFSHMNEYKKFVDSSLEKIGERKELKALFLDT